MNYKIFVDMDDVLTDLHKRLMDTGKLEEDTFDKIEEKSLRDELFWNIVNPGGVEFWSEMEWTPNGKKLWELIFSHNPTILSACNKDGIYVKEGKKIWIKNNLGSLYDINYILCLREHKRTYAHHNTVLIDDRKDNIAEWEENGGIGILYEDKNFEIIKLKIIQYLI